MDATSWFGVAALAIHVLQGGIHIAKHFRLSSECCGKKSGIEWDASTPPKPENQETVLRPTESPEPPPRLRLPAKVQAAEEEYRSIPAAFLNVASVAPSAPSLRLSEELPGTASQKRAVEG